MTLMNCPECEQSVSSNALECPHCGNPLKEQVVKFEQQPKTPAKAYRWGTLIYIIMIIAGILTMLEGEWTGLLLIAIGIGLIVGQYKFWSENDRKIK